MAATEAQRRAADRWTKRNQRGQVCIKFYEADGDLADRVKAAAESEGMTMTAWCKAAIIEKIGK